MQRDDVAALSPSRYGLSPSAAPLNVDGILWTRAFGPAESGPEHMTLAQIERRLNDVYVGRVAYEFMHSPSKAERLWFAHMLESQAEEAVKAEWDNERRRRVHALLAKSETMDRFLQAKFPNLKRYGLEGGESMLPALDALFRVAALGEFGVSCSSRPKLTIGIAGIEQVILAMPHRGRLNLLTDLLAYEPAALFHKIRGHSEVPEELGATGDVISHLSASFHSCYLAIMADFIIMY